jgi:hypothetical protein
MMAKMRFFEVTGLSKDGRSGGGSIDSFVSCKLGKYYGKVRPCSESLDLCSAFHFACLDGRIMFLKEIKSLVLARKLYDILEIHSCDFLFLVKGLGTGKTILHSSSLW